MNLAKNIARSIVSPIATRITDFIGRIAGNDGLLPTYPGAAGAYSLRSLTGKASTTVVRLRRGSDSTERDFTADELTGSVTGAELIAEPNFASSTGWNAGSGWVISGGTATLTSTAGNDFLSASSLPASDYYLMTITIDSCSDFGEVGLRIASNNYRPFSDFGITTAGTYAFMVDRAYNDLATTARFFEQGTAGVSCVLSRCSLKPHTPSAAELWAMNVTNSFYPWKVDGSFDAYATTWYDQSASNEQVFDDPTMQSSDWSFSKPDGSAGGGSMSMTKAGTGTENQVGTCNIANYGGAFRVEIDYTTTNAADDDWLFFINDINNRLLFPAGSGTLTADFYEVPVAGSLTIRTFNVAASGSSITVTGIRLIDIGNPATQTTLDAQPKLITAGVTELENGKPALVFDGVDDVLDIPIVPTDLTLSVFNVLAPSLATNDDMAIQFLKDSSNIMAMGVGGLGSNAEFGLRLYEGAANTDTSGIASSASQTLLTGVTVAATSAQIYANGVAGGLSSSSRIDSSGQSSISSNSSRLWEGTFQELIAYPSDQSAGRTGIETNINGHYGIYFNSQNWVDSNFWDDTFNWQD